MPNKFDFKLPKEKKEEMIAKIKGYFLTERNEELGDLGAGILLDFFLDNLAADFYNLGVNDAHKYIGDHLEDVLSIQKF